MNLIKHELQEKDILHDVLVSEKDIVKIYGTSIIESSCPKMRDLLTKNMQQATADQFEVFTNMNKRGYYPTENAPASKVEQAKTQFATLQKEMNACQ